MKQTDLAWLAGLYEGEGCLYLGKRITATKVNRKGENLYQWDITSTDIDILEKAKTLVGLGKIVNIGRRQEHHKIKYRYRLYSAHEIYKVMKLLYPWLGIRRKKKADDFFKFYESVDIQTRQEYTEGQKCKGCGNEIIGQRGQGYCKSCYHHWYRHGDPLKGSRREAIAKDEYKDRPMFLHYDIGQKCIDCGCGDKKLARGMCSTCYMRWRRKSKYKFAKK